MGAIRMICVFLLATEASGFTVPSPQMQTRPRAMGNARTGSPTAALAAKTAPLAAVVSKAKAGVPVGTAVVAWITARKVPVAIALCAIAVGVFWRSVVVKRAAAAEAARKKNADDFFSPLADLAGAVAGATVATATGIVRSDGKSSAPAVKKAEAAPEPEPEATKSKVGGLFGGRKLAEAEAAAKAAQQRVAEVEALLAEVAPQIAEVAALKKQVKELTKQKEELEKQLPATAAGGGAKVRCAEQPARLNLPGHSRSTHGRARVCARLPRAQKYNPFFNPLKGKK